MYKKDSIRHNEQRQPGGEAFLKDQPYTELLRESVCGYLNKDIDQLKILLNYPENEDVIFKNCRLENLQLCLIYIEGMADEKKIGEFVLHALKNKRCTGDACCDPMESVKDTLELPQFKSVQLYSQIVQQILAGMCCLLADGSDEALMMETRNYPHRAVSQPTNESVVDGPHEAFNEHLRTNISLIRRYIQSRNLISEKQLIGSEIQTQVAVLYLKGVASEASLNEVRKRLKCITAAAVMGTGGLQQLMEDHPYALLPQMLQTERPDRAASCIEDGQIAILVENSPYALIAPVTLFHLVHASDDSFLRWQYGSALRIIRVLGLAVSLTLPAVYIATTLYHSHLIPMPLLTSIAESRANVPFPIVVEVLFMEFSFYLLNEAGLRTPSQIGSAFGIVGALILGQAAVSASIISPILIIIIALTGLGNYVVPNYGFGIGLILYRLFLILMSALLGLYGLSIGLFLILLQLSSMKSFGIYYLAPVAPKRRHNPDIILRLPLWMQKYAMFFARKRNWMNPKGETQ